MQQPSSPRPRVQQALAPSAAPREIPRAQEPQAADAPAPRVETGGTIYLCRDYSGASFWASDHCNRHNALIDRMVSVPPGMPFQQQVALAEQRRQALAPPQSISTAGGQANTASPDRSLCEALDARVNQLDAMARQPQSAGTQDWIRQERQKTRDEQFRLHC